MFTKDDVYVHEVYSPPAGEKEVFLFPRALGGTDYWTFNKQFKLKADRRTVHNGYEWTLFHNFVYKLFSTQDRFTIFHVVNFLNKPSEKRKELFRALIDNVFKEDL